MKNEHSSNIPVYTQLCVYSDEHKAHRADRKQARGRVSQTAVKASN